MAEGQSGNVDSFRLPPSLEVMIFGGFNPSNAFEGMSDEEVQSRLLDTTQDSTNVYEFSKLITEYAREEDVEDIIYIDRSARLAAVGVREYWRLRYSGEDQPDAHFVNPLIAREPSEVELLARPAMEELSMGIFKQQMEDSKSSLLDKKTKPVLLVDGCTHSGETLGYTKMALEACGLEDIRTAVFSDDSGDSEPMIKPDLALRVADPVCNPFLRDHLVATNMTSIYASYQGKENPSEHRRSRALRAKIKSIVHEGLLTADL